MKSDDELYEDDEVKEENNSTLATIYYENKKLIWILIIVILLIILMVIFGKTTSKPKNDDKTVVTVSSQVETIYVNNTKQLKAEVNTNNNPTINWTSSDSSIVSVDSYGNIRGLKEGKAIITATYKNGNDTYTSTCEVTVLSGNTGVNLTSIKFRDGVIIMAPNSTYNLSFERIPGEAMITSTVYTSSNESVAKVDNNGQVTAIGVGNGTINLNANNGITSSINVIVIDKQVTPGIYILPTSLEFKEKTYDITVGDGIKLYYDVLPNNANLTLIEYSSNNPKVATVDNTGYVKGLMAGDATITIKCGNVSGAATVHVNNKVIEVRSISVSDNNVSLKVGDTHQIEAKIAPTDATDKELVYTPNDPTIVSVREDGFVTGISSGSTYITVSSKSRPSVATNVFFKVTGNSSSNSNGGGNGNSSGGNSNGVATVKITSNNSSVEVSYENALKEERTSYPTLTITPYGNYSSIKYCTYTYGVSNTCTPNITYNGPFELRKTGITVIKARAIYNGKEGEILTRYVNIKSNSSSNLASCYCNPNDGTCTYGKSSSTYTTDVNLTEGLCNDYINRGNQGCFINNGNYVWGSYLGKSSTYVYMSGVTNSGSCNSSSNSGGTTPSGTNNQTSGFHVNWGKSYGYNLAIDRVRIFEFKVSSTANINRVYFCESNSGTKCTIDMNSATKKTKHFDLRVLSSSVYSTDSTYNKTYYFEDLSGTNFTFYIATERGHSVTLLATDVNKRVTESFSTTAQ